MGSYYCKAINYYFLVLQQDKGSSHKMRKGHSSIQNEKRMTLGLQAFLTLFLSLERY